MSGAPSCACWPCCSPSPRWCSALLNIVGSLGKDSMRVRQTYTGVRVVDVHLGAESVEVRQGLGDTTRLDRTVTWSLRTPTVVTSHCPFSMGRGCGGHVLLVVPAGTEVHARSSVSGTGLRSGDVTASSSAGSSNVAVRTDPESDRTIRAHSSAGSVTVRYPAR